MTRGFRIFALLCICLLAGLSRSRAQDTANAFSIGLQAGVSHSGWNLALVGNYHQSPFSAYLGPSISLNRGLPPKGPIGLAAGLNYHIPSQKDWLSSLVNLDYQLNFFHLQADHTDIIHELNLSYGLVFHITPEIYVVQQLGYGMYFESVYLENEGRRKMVSGYDGLVRLRAGYLF